MDALILIASVVLPLIPVVLFPTRFIGRGLGSTVLGAALIVGMMMLVYWSLSGFGGLGTSVPGGTADASADPLAGISDKDMAALEKLLGD